KLGKDVLERIDQSMGRLEDYERPGLAGYRPEKLSSLRRPSWQESEVQELVGGQARRRERRDRRRWTGNGHDWYPLVDRRLHQRISGIRDRRHSRFRYERQISLLKAIEKHSNARALVVLEITHQRLVNVVSVEQLARLTSVLRGDKWSFPENPKGPKGDVFEISD